MLKTRNTIRRFGNFTAADSVSLAIDIGEFFTLLGPSGCGKTTFLRMLVGFDQPDSGEIRLDGQDLADIEPEKCLVYTMFQSYALFPYMSMAQNITFPLRTVGVAKSETDARVEQALKDARLVDKGGRTPTQLSGSQRQRMAIAHVLANRPRLLPLDRSLLVLDAKLYEGMQTELINLQRGVGITFVYATHDWGEALALSHHIVAMNRGRVEQLDVPETIYSSLRSRFAADFTNQYNPLDATVEAVDGERVCVGFQGLDRAQALKSFGAQSNEAHVLTLWPGKIRLARSATTDSDGAHFRGHVTEPFHLGDVTLYTVGLENGECLETLLPNITPGRVKFSKAGGVMKTVWCFDTSHPVRA